MMPELMKNASPGATCAMSETGWSNSEIFRKYLKEHFLKFIPRREPDEHLLLLLDGHKSHLLILLNGLKHRILYYLFYQRTLPMYCSLWM